MCELNREKAIEALEGLPLRDKNGVIWRDAWALVDVLFPPEDDQEPTHD